MKKQTIYILIIALFSPNSVLSKPSDLCYEDSLLQKYIKFSKQNLFVSSYSGNIDSLKCGIDEVPVKPSWFEFMFDNTTFPWEKNDWLSIRIAKPDDMKYIDTIRSEEVCPGKFVRSKDGYSVSNTRPDCLVGPPVVSDFGYYINANPIPNSNYYRLTDANVFVVNTGDSSGIALWIDTLFDGRPFGPNSKKNLDRSKVQKINFNAKVTIGSTKYQNGAFAQYRHQFDSYPEFRLFHLPDDHGMFVIWGQEVNGDGIAVYELSISRYGVSIEKKFTDFYIDDKPVHTTEYSVENGVLKRKIMKLDEKSGIPHYLKAKWSGMWKADN
jgi:hypothetical protein